MKIFEKIENLKVIYNKVQKKSDNEKQNSINSVDKKGVVKRTVFTMLSPGYWFLLGGSIFASAMACFIPSIILKVLNTLLNSSIIANVIHSKSIFIITFIVVLTFFLKAIFKSEKNDIIEDDAQYYNVDQDSIKLLMQYMYQLNELNKEMKYLVDSYEDEDDENEVKKSYELYRSFEENLKEMLNDNDGKLMISDFNDLKDIIDDYQEQLDGYGADVKSNEIITTLREQIIAESENLNVKLTKEVINEH